MYTESPSFSFRLHIDYLEIFGLVNHLLVRVGCLITHDYVAPSRVDFRIQTRVFDKVNNPAFGVVGIHIELLGQHFNAKDV